MADNVAITPGSGVSVAADDTTNVNGVAVASNEVQRVKAGYGTDGVFHDVDPNHGLPVSVRSLPFQLLQRTVLAAPQTVTGNPVMAYDGNETVYFLAVSATTNAQIYAYNLHTQILTQITGSTTVPQLYSGSALLYANGKLYFSRGGAFNAFYAINPDGTGFTTLTSCSTNINFGCAMAYDGADLIYLINATPALQKYSISGNAWTALATPLTSGTEGVSLALVGTTKLYSTTGAGTTGFAVYDLPGNAWTAKAPTPANVYDGGALAWAGGNFLYALGGQGSQNLWRYDLVANAWTILPTTPIPVSTGSTLIPRADGNFLAYLTEPSNLTGYGTVNNVYLFDPSKINLVNSGVPVTGRYNSSQPALSSTQANELQLAADGSLATAPDTTTEGQSDGLSNTLRVIKDIFGFAPVAKVFGFMFNGTTWDRMRGDATNGLYVNVKSATPPADLAVNGSFTASGQTLALSPVGVSTVTMQLSGTWVGGVSIQISNGGGVWNDLRLVDAGGGTGFVQAGGNGFYKVDVPACALLQVKCAAYTSGTITVYARTGIGSGPVELLNPLPFGTNPIGSVAQSGTWTVGSSSVTWGPTLNTSASGSAATLTQAAAGAAVRNYLSGFTFSWQGAAMVATTTIQVKDGATVIYEEYVGSAATTGSISRTFPTPLRGTANTALTVVCSAGATSQIQKLNAWGTTGS